MWGCTNALVGGMQEPGAGRDESGDRGRLGIEERCLEMIARGDARVVVETWTNEDGRRAPAPNRHASAASEAKSAARRVRWREGLRGRQDWG